MARIDSERFTEDTSHSSIKGRVDEKVRATYRICEKNGELFYQIKTYGSDGRECSHLASQSIEIDKDVAVKIIEDLQRFLESSGEGIEKGIETYSLIAEKMSNEEIVSRRLDLWKRKRDGAYFRIIKSFFASCAERNSEYASYEWMKNVCGDRDDDEYYTDHFEYLKNYMIRENSQTGRIFKKNGDLVALADDVKAIILKYKVWFYNE